MSDAAARRDAIGRTDANVVLRASAGTGKTTVLVERLLLLLVRDRVPPERIVAITFTEDAAANMKSRLRRRLLDAFRWGQGEDVRPPLHEALEELGRAEVAARAAAALEPLDRAVVETIHAFAGRLLRTFPEESRVDAAFVVEDEAAVAESIDRHWAAWSRAELAEESERLDRWRRVLRALPWDAVRELAWRLADFQDVPEDPGTLPDGARRWLEGAAARLDALAKKARKATACVTQAAEAAALLKRAAASGWKPPQEGDAAIDGSFAGLTAGCGWLEEEYAEARSGWQAARAWSRVREEAAEAVRLAAGFARHHQEASLASGRVSFNALLVLARDMLRAHPHLARRFDHHRFLVDEFQDTDEKQAEIVLRLAAPAAPAGTPWQHLRPRAGALFVVGDPKQSIYAWRGADLGVHDAVCAQLAGAGALDLRLALNFRCQPGVVDAANRIFAAAFVESPGIQAPPAPLEAARAAKALGGRILEVRRAAVEKGAKAPAKARAEARAIAAWISQLRGDPERRVMLEEEGRPEAPKPVRLRDIAILVRQATHLQEYLHALRDLNIPYVVTREQHFYEAAEVRDAINLLLALVRPDDAQALAGVLRSPAGGLTFDEMHALGRPDYRRDAPGRAGALFAKLREIRRTALALPVPEAVDLILDASGLRAAAAASAHGEQALANLEKVAALAARRASPDLTLRGFADMLGRHLLDPEREAESPLGEPDDEVVRVSTIHGAKGLEWPVVILAGLHQGSRGGGPGDPVLSDAAGFAAQCGDAVTPAWGWLDDRRRRRGEAELTRLFYVACTRAREALVLSAAGDGDGPFLKLLPDGVLPAVEAPAGASPPRFSLPAPATPMSDEELAEWQARRDEFDAAMKLPAVDSPSAILHREEEESRPRGHAWADPAARVTGVLVHRVLEHWDFAGDDLDAALARAAADLRPQEARDAVAAARALLERFLGTPEAREIAGGRILGREVPFVWPYKDGRAVTGVVDLIFEKDGRIEIRDYKTGREDARYETQKEIYVGVVKKLFPGREVGFRFLYMAEETEVRGERGPVEGR